MTDKATRRDIRTFNRLIQDQAIVLPVGISCKSFDDLKKLGKAHPTHGIFVANRVQQNAILKAITPLLKKDDGKLYSKTSIDGFAASMQRAIKKLRILSSADIVSKHFSDISNAF